MAAIDWPTLGNWIISGFIGAVFGAAGAWIVYGLARKRDDVNWQRQIQENQRQWEWELRERERQKLIDQLTKDIHDPNAIRELAEKFRKENFGLVDSGLTILDAIQIIRASTELVITRLQESEPLP